MSATREPWTVDRHRVAGSYGILASHRDKHGAPIYVGYAPKKQDAQLMAAAPEMRKLLKNLIRMDTGNIADDHWGYDAYEEILARLDKALAPARDLLRQLEGGSK